MEKRKGSGLAGAMEGKGFYMVLFLCAAVIAAAAWLLIAGNDAEEPALEERTVDISDAVVTMLPAGTPMEEDAVAVSAMQEDEPAMTEDEAAETAVEEDDWEEAASSVLSYVWPVQGSIETPYAVETLVYDPTMADWRAHPGLDIACAAGDAVLAAAGGTVDSVENDDLLGTTVVIDHENGVQSVYANLAAEPPVSEGDWVSMGQVVGSVGGTALAETNVVPHLHLAMTRDGSYIDPQELLPELNGE